MDRLFMRVVRLGQATQKHCRCGDVLVRPSEVQGIIPPVHGVVLDLTGVPPGHRSPVYARGAQCGASGVPAQLVADAATVVVVPPCAQV